MACSSSDNETQGGALNQLIGHMTMTSGNNIASTVDKCSRSNTYNMSWHETENEHLFLTQLNHLCCNKTCHTTRKWKKGQHGQKSLKNTQYKNL